MEDEGVAATQKAISLTKTWLMKDFGFDQDSINASKLASSQPKPHKKNHQLGKDQRKTKGQQLKGKIVS